MTMRDISRRLDRLDSDSPVPVRRVVTRCVTRTSPSLSQSRVGARRFPTNRRR